MARRAVRLLVGAGKMWYNILICFARNYKTKTYDTRRFTMKRLLRYLNDYKKESVLAPLFKMLEASFELFVPLVVAQIVDVGIKTRKQDIF